MKLMQFYMGQGQSSKFNETFDEWLVSLRGYLPEMGVVQNATQACGLASIAGSDEHVKKYFNSATEKFPQVKPVLDCITNYLFLLFKNDLEEFQKYNQGQCKAMVMQGSPDLEYYVNGNMSSMAGDHEAALESYNTFIEKSGAGGKEFGYQLAKEYRLLGQPKKAIKVCEETLSTAPNSSVFLLELALAQMANGDKAEARKTYEKLSKVWKHAEPTFLYYEQFKELEEQVGAT